MPVSETKRPTPCLGRLARAACHCAGKNTFNTLAFVTAKERPMHLARTRRWLRRPGLRSRTTRRRNCRRPWHP